jgi:glycosyltransferase involved in cell wall biosynthesis
MDVRPTPEKDSQISGSQVVPVVPFIRDRRPFRDQNSILTLLDEIVSLSGQSAISVLINSDIDSNIVHALIFDSRVKSIILRDQYRVTYGDHDPRIGYFDPTANHLIGPVYMERVLVVCGEPIRPGLSMATSACMRGGLFYYQRTTTLWQKYSFIATVYRQLKRWLGFLVLSRLRAWRMSDWLIGSRTKTVVISNSSEKTLTIHESPLLQKDEFVGQRVLMVNSALAWGGAERQLVNSMIGLARRGYDVHLLCESLSVVPDSDFFSWRLQDSDLSAKSIRRSLDQYTYEEISAELADVLTERIARLPSPFRESIAPYVMEMLAQRPEVVYAWQDQTSVIAGVAAAIVGVPRIVLSTRNMSPPNFAYFQPHMRNTYRALLLLPQVRIINNSHAGLADYANWLSVGTGSFQLLYNGVDFDLFEPPSRKAIGDYRQKLGIPAGCRVVGSIFRLYQEKDPFLWLETASLVAKCHPEIVFLVIGVGPLRDQMLEMARKYAMNGRLLLPGTEKRPELPLAIMDVFLLTSRFEGLPNVVIEAQSQGVPVVTTAAGGSGEAIEPGVTGWLVETRDASQLADRVNYVLQDEKWAKKARQRAKDFVRERFDLERMIDETVGTFETIRLQETYRIVNSELRRG